jgi:hypothetical protein
MIQPKYSPRQALERAKLLMNYDTSKTLTENKQNINEYNFGIPNWGVAAAAPVASTTTTAATTAIGGGGAATSWPALLTAISTPAAAGLGIVALVGTALYWAYRNADNEDALRKTVEACKAGATAAGGEAQLMKDSLLGKDSHIDIGREIYAAIEGEGTWNDMIGLGKLGGLGTNEEQIFAAAEKLSKGNAADICGVVFEYQGKDFVDDLAEDLDEADLSKVIASFRKAVSDYAGEGKVFPPNSYNVSWYRGMFPCIFKNVGTVDAKSVGKDANGYTYIVVSGLRRSDGSVRKYRLRGEDGTLLSEDGTKVSNAKIVCDGSTPRTVTESKLNKVIIKEQGIDDSKVVFRDELLDTNAENWASGKYNVPWNAWVRKFPCLGPKFPNSTPKVDSEGYTYFENKQPSNNRVYRMYSDGQIWTDDDVIDTGKRWSCAPRGGKIIIESARKKNILEQLEIEPNTSGGGGGGGIDHNTSGSGFKPCDGTYKRGCVSEKIRKLQGCLGGLVADGRWGDKTQKVISAKYPKFSESLTDNDIETICQGSQTTQNDIGGEQQFTDPNDF